MPAERRYSHVTISHELARNLGLRLKQERVRRGLTRKRFAELLGFSHNFIAHLERGTRIMSLGTLVKMAEFLRLHPWELIAPLHPVPPLKQEDLNRVLAKVDRIVFLDREGQQLAEAFLTRPRPVSPERLKKDC